MNIEQDTAQLYTEKNLRGLERKLDVLFERKDLLIQAVTRKAYVKDLVDNDPDCTRQDNERLEFLGDSVLELIMREHLYEQMPTEEVGDLASECRDIVKRRSLAKVASEFGLGEHLFLTETEEGVLRRTPRILADSLEAVIGAVFLETDYERTSDVVLKHIYQGHKGKTRISPEDLNTQ